MRDEGEGRALSIGSLHSDKPCHLQLVQAGSGGLLGQSRPLAKLAKAGLERQALVECPEMPNGQRRSQCTTSQRYGLPKPCPWDWTT